MNNDRAFDFDDLILLLALDPTDPADESDIEAIDEILARRRASAVTGERRPQQRSALRLVADTPP
ncbi:hypothetical protein [Pseudonocardia kunmingensis]|uniref:Uncharacterized protein n=1 Tax=Pseudonocardia kunmingensis TaxID=630975 RepID=A0A543E260_9PSEU|nr:hypothetical protein [Pseudonocardia kunmingensis]TQM15674.1 hypothetical protein FB558_2464 [Pseudonocardia kunmingensis]